MYFKVAVAIDCIKTRKKRVAVKNFQKCSFIVGILALYVNNMQLMWFHQ